MISSSGRLAAAICAALLWSATAEASVSLDPSGDLSALPPGSLFSVNVDTDATATDGITINLTYDASVLSYTGGSFNPGFSLTNAQSQPDGATGIITINGIVGSTFFTPPVAGPATLATLNFAALAAGASQVSFKGFLNLGTTAFDDFDLALNAVVTPVPAALPLLATALAGLGLARAGRRRAGSNAD